MVHRADLCVHDRARGRVLSVQKYIGSSVHVSRREVNRRGVELTISEDVRGTHVRGQGVDEERRPHRLCDHWGVSGSDTDGRGL